MKKEIQLKTLLIALQKQKFKKHIQLNIEGNKTSNGFMLKIKSISVPREFYKAIGFDDQEVINNTGGVVKKQPTTRELLEKLAITVDDGFKSVNKRLDDLEARVANIEVRVEEMANTPTMKKELKQTKKSA